MAHNTHGVHDDFHGTWVHRHQSVQQSLTCAAALTLRMPSPSHGPKSSPPVCVYTRAPASRCARSHSAYAAGMSAV